MFDFIEDDTYEHCGMFIGTPEFDHSEAKLPKIQHVVELPNRAENTELNYRIYESDMNHALYHLKRTNMSVVGFWHTHPSHALKRPSQADLDSIALGERHWWHAVVHLSSRTIVWYDYFDNFVEKELPRGKHHVRPRRSTRVG